MAKSDFVEQNASENLGTRLNALAQDVLECFSVVSADARAMLTTDRPADQSALAVLNTMTSDKAMRRLVEIGDLKRKALREQIAEPAIARLVVSDVDGRQEEIFICRGTPFATSGRRLASYRSPIGRLAALPVGTEHEIVLPNGPRWLEVLERAALRPLEEDGIWDSLNTVVHQIGAKPVTVKSLRSILIALAEANDDTDVLDALFREEQSEANVIQGLRRSVLQKMGLRDQPLLDAFQDAVYRLPLGSSVVLLGPPGSGKTTTLIKRLGLKLDPDYLDDDERTAVAQSRSGLAEHPKSWLMFTPTELLKQYVKEAFGREGVPASDLRMKTWTDFRRDLARNRLGVLRTARGQGAVLKDELPSLLPTTVDTTLAWFEDFEQWQRQSFWIELAAAAEDLLQARDGRVRALGEKLAKALESASDRVGAAPFLALERASTDLDKLLAAISQSLKDRLRNLLSARVRAQPTMLDELAAFLETLHDGSEDEVEDGEVEDEDEEDTPAANKGRRQQAFDAYMRAVSSDARAVAQRRRLGRNSRAGRIIGWLGDRVLSEEERLEVGRSLLVQTVLRRFRKPLRNYLSRIPARYRRFRAERRAEGRWYHPDGYGPMELGPLEVDAVLLAVLREANAFLTNRLTAARADEELPGILVTVRDLWCNQVVVDEATDFSPVQLACMAALVDPATGGFIACGDFNQRITAWGSRSTDELKWVLPKLDLRPITITYRHSRQLNEFAQAIASASGDPGTAATLPEDVDNEGVPPVLGLSLSEDAAAAWLARRIIEIEQFTGELPSIAVLVDSEPEVAPLAKALDDALADRNIRAVACPNGQVVGQDLDVRVFAVDHIKGLEFEAVFFVGVDKLATARPSSFDKHLYVGATRAAMYLGVTCHGTLLPPLLEPLRMKFADSWH